MNGIGGDPNTIRTIGNVAERICSHAKKIIDSHRFTTPGPHHTPWTYEFQSLAVPIYATQLPWDYLNQLAAGFEDAAQLMLTVTPPATIGLEWTRMEHYLHNSARAISHHTPEHHTTGDTPVSTADQLDPETPAIMPYRLLAELISVQGAADLYDTGNTIHKASLHTTTSPLTAEQQKVLQHLANGDKIHHIAAATNLSPRSIHRRLDEIYATLGVNDRYEAVTIALANGWISVI